MPWSVTLQDAGRESIEEDSIAVRELVLVVQAGKTRGREGLYSLTQTIQQWWRCSTSSTAARLC